jgi:hypothetical protein
LAPPWRRRAWQRRAPRSRCRAAPCRGGTWCRAPLECEQQRRDESLLDAWTDRATSCRWKVPILSCRRALPAIIGIARQIEGTHTGSKATITEQTPPSLSRSVPYNGR